jgi:hypothetical protein
MSSIRATSGYAVVVKSATDHPITFIVEPVLAKVDDASFRSQMTERQPATTLNIGQVS